VGTRISNNIIPFDPKKTKAFGSFYFNQKERKCPWIFFEHMDFTNQMKKKV